MRKTRILFCSEATFLNTGYATYTREILKYLYSTGKYEIAELAAYGMDKDPRSKAPWKFFGVMPDPSNQELTNLYKSNPKSQFGGFAFERVCLEFLPDIVCDIRDFWMTDFVHNSPFRKFFKWALMPTVDAYPQAKEWINMYSAADACLSYSDWSGEVLKKQSRNKINYIGTASPSADLSYKPIENKESLRESLGIDPNTKIIGTVMRNQRRKLYPDLFSAFRKFLYSSNNPNEYKLYCHTSYPDAGWDLPEILSEHSLHSYVLFTYVCLETGRFFASHFHGAVTRSPFTGKFSAKLANVKNGLSYPDLAKIMNCFDLYVQYANSEGFGLPQVEAASCGIPVMSIDYSAMSSVIKKLNGYAIPYKSLYKEMETGCERAVPDNDAAAQMFSEFFSKPLAMRKKEGFEMRQNFLKKFQWEISGKVWESYFDSVETLSLEKSWKSPVDIQKPERNIPEELNNAPYPDVVNWLFDKALCKPQDKYNYEYDNILNNLIYGFSTSPIIGSFFNEDDSVVSLSKKIENQPFTIQYAHEQLVNKRNNINLWETKRAEVFNL